MLAAAVDLSRELYWYTAYILTDLVPVLVGVRISAQGSVLGLVYCLQGMRFLSQVRAGVVRTLGCMV